jgi:hypothetical protein
LLLLKHLSLISVLKHDFGMVDSITMAQMHFAAMAMNHTQKQKYTTQHTLDPMGTKKVAVKSH